MEKLKPKITIQNPEAINSLNLTMGYENIEVVLSASNLENYLYTIRIRERSKVYMVKLNRYIRNDKNMAIEVEDSRGYVVAYYLFPLEQMKNRNKFLDWLVEKADENFK